MNEHLLVLVICLAVILVLAILIYVASRSQISAITATHEIRHDLQQVLANTEKIERSLHDQRRVLYDAHKRISAVTKGVENPPAKPNETNGRIYPIRPCQKVWVMAQAMTHMTLCPVPLNTMW